MSGNIDMRLCFMHNTGEKPAAKYHMLLPIGNVVPLCSECCAWWRADILTNDDPCASPVWIRSISADLGAT